jgi:quinoprotein glucose dehydrogenase
MERRKPAKASSSGRELYQRECAACHGADRQGTALARSLAGIGEHYNAEEVALFVSEGSGRMPGFARLGAGLYAIVDYLMTGRDSEVSHSTGDRSSPYELEYRLASLNRLQDPEGYPGIKPPWGTLSAIDLNTGEYVWRIPLGEYPALAAQGLPDTGTENYGGPVVTAGGLVFIGATIYDKKFRAFDKLTGELLWETTLLASAHATPAVYEIDGKQFVVIAAGGGKAGAFSDVDSAAPKRDDSGATYVAFALPERSRKSVNQDSSHGKP